MLVPERLALIGGSILLSSLLIFSIKNHMGHLMPNVVQGVASSYGNTGDSFYVDMRGAQRSGAKVGTWGSSPYYIDKENNMHVGAGQLSGHLHDVIGGDEASQIQSLTFDEHVQAPSDSSFLLSTSDRGIMGVTHLQSIHGLDRVDTSQITSMNNIFSNDAELTNLNLSSWDLTNVQDLSFAFWGNRSLQQLDLASWDTSHISNMRDMFDVTNQLHRLTLGNDTYIHDGSHAGLSNSQSPSTTFHDSNQSLNIHQFEDGNAHPGTWSTP